MCFSFKAAALRAMTAFFVSLNTGGLPPQLPLPRSLLGNRAGSPTFASSYPNDGGNGCLVFFFLLALKQSSRPCLVNILWFAVVRSQRHPPGKVDKASERLPRRRPIQAQALGNPCVARRSKLLRMNPQDALRRSELIVFSCCFFCDLGDLATSGVWLLQTAQRAS